jgi:hypothetical protein
VTTLDDYLDAASRRKWSWGKMDCVQFGLEWARARSERPLRVPLVYWDAAAAAAFLEPHGGLLAVVSEWMDAYGFMPTDAPDDGDIGVAPIDRSDRMNIAGAAVVIRRGPWWIGKALRGLASIPSDRIPAWRIS